VSLPLRAGALPRRGQLPGPRVRRARGLVGTALSKTPRPQLRRSREEVPVRRTISFLVGVALASALSAAEPPKTVAQLDRDAREAYKRGDMAAFLRDYEELARLRPGDVRILYNLACAQARNGQADAALATLRRYASYRVAADLDADDDFESIRQTAG